MKILKTFTAIALTAIASLTTTKQISAQERPVTNEPASFNRIEVKGNVEVILIQREKFGLAYSDTNTGEVKVTQRGHSLTISSSSFDRPKLNVYVDNTFFRISADEQASIRTRGKLKLEYLQLILKNHASAEINSETKGLYSAIYDKAKLKLIGSTQDHNLVMGKTPKLNANNFVALKITTLPISENTLAASVN